MMTASVIAHLRHNAFASAGQVIFLYVRGEDRRFISEEDRCLLTSFSSFAKASVFAGLPSFKCGSSLSRIWFSIRADLSRA